MDQESGSINPQSRLKLDKTSILLAYQSLGVIYGDICASPLYVYKSTFSGNLKAYQEDDEIFGILSLIFWALTLIPLLKYGIFVLGAVDNGEGGTFALYSLLCRHANMGVLKSCNGADVSACSVSSEISAKETSTSLFVERFFWKSHALRLALLMVVLLGTGMLIGDGILTPTLSVLSAVHGIHIKFEHLNQNYSAVIACIILVGLFALQHRGTHRVSWIFSPILTTWLLCISGVGIYNIFQWNPSVINALSPYYIYIFFKKTGKNGWRSLGGIVLCLAGSEAMFAGVGHFSQLSVRFAFTLLVYPCLVLSYMGEAAYLSRNKDDLHSSFYKSIPESIFWPVLVIATLATVAASQATISATFSTISQCRTLGCFPRVKIVYTSSNIHGRVYIPEVNWMMMLFCVAVIAGFRDTKSIANAYGLAAITVMFITTMLMFLIICTVWKQSVFLSFLFVLIFGSVELVYFSACLTKVHKGGWLPLTVSLLVVSLMSAWHYGTSRKHAYEQENRVSLQRLLTIGPNQQVTRVPGICIVYSNLTSDVPPMFAHFVTNFPAFHQVLIFVTLESLMVPRVPDSDRFHFQRIDPPELFIFRCIVSYGYKDAWDSYGFETALIENMAEFLTCECNSKEVAVVEQTLVDVKDALREGKGSSKSGGGIGTSCKKVRFKDLGESSRELGSLMEAKEAGMAYMIGNSSVTASEASSFLKRFAIDIVYGFLRSNSRSPASVLWVPRTSLIEVGMVYRV